MTTTEYRDAMHGLRDAISDFKACANYGERALASGRLDRWWRRLALIDQPRRLPQYDKDKSQRYLKQAAEILNNWLIEVNAGFPEQEERQAPPKQAMEDTMRFCAAVKRRGLAS